MSVEEERRAVKQREEELMLEVCVSAHAHRGCVWLCGCAFVCAGAAKACVTAALAS